MPMKVVALKFPAVKTMAVMTTGSPKEAGGRRGPNAVVARRRRVAVAAAGAIASLIAADAGGAYAAVSDPAGPEAASGGDAGRPLAGSELRKTIAGKRVYLATPLGGEFPLFYRADGRVDGSGEAVGLGRFLKPSDSGRWWVDGARLCQQWQTWYSGKVFCFTVTGRGPGRIGWVRDDGAEGTARLAE
jgi:hypothetical protein